jgi:hypothetical protein
MTTDRTAQQGVSDMTDQSEQRLLANPRTHRKLTMDEWRAKFAPMLKPDATVLDTLDVLAASADTLPIIAKLAADPRVREQAALAEMRNREQGPPPGPTWPVFMAAQQAQAQAEGREFDVGEAYDAFVRMRHASGWRPYGIVAGAARRRWLADRIDGIEPTQQERAVALEIADRVHDDTNRGWGDGLLGIVAQRAGVKGETDEQRESNVRKILTKLAKKGLEFRLPMLNSDGTCRLDRRGNIVYAVPGRLTTYHVPNEEQAPKLKGRCAAALDDYAGPQGPPNGTGRAAVQETRAAAQRPEGRHSAAPTSDHLRGTSALSPAHRALSRIGVEDHDEREDLIAKIEQRHKPETGGWWHKVGGNGDLITIVANIRDATTIVAINPNTPDQAAARRQGIDACSLCDGNGLIETDTGACRRCDHPAAPELLADHESTP